jgi:hypothetical protein
MFSFVPEVFAPAGPDIDPSKPMITKEIKCIKLGLVLILAFNIGMLICASTWHTCKMMKGPDNEYIWNATSSNKCFIKTSFTLKEEVPDFGNSDNYYKEYARTERPQQEDKRECTSSEYHSAYACGYLGWGMAPGMMVVMMIIGGLRSAHREKHKHH